MYFDPVIGSLFFQWVLGGLLAGVFVLGFFRVKIAGLFRSVLSRLSRRKER